MTTEACRPVPLRPPVGGARDPRPPVRYYGPNWYAAVMGTAIVANAGAVLPSPVPGLRWVYVAVWALSALALLAVAVVRTARWRLHRDRARAELLDPAVAPFHGCRPMALLAVGGGTLAVGRDVIGVRAAVAVDVALWSAGTLMAVVVAVAVPYLLITRHRPGYGEASPVWLLPVVAPMVSAALGPPLVPHLPRGQWREAMLLGSAALFGMSLLATLALLPLVLGRLVHHGPLPAVLTPALCLVLGPLGQSTTAAAAMADVSPAPGGYLALAYGAPVMGFALLWMALSGAMVVRAVRRGMPFAMTWWGFTFPVGTCVTGTAGLARHSGLTALTWAAVGLYALLVTAWAVVAARTALGLARGTLFAPPAPPASSAPPAGPPRRAPAPGPARQAPDAPVPDTPAPDAPVAVVRAVSEPLPARP